MNAPTLLKTAASSSNKPSTAAVPAGKQICTALEVLVVYAGILLYIWRWQTTHPRLWMALWGVILLSHVLHRDTPRTLGLLGAELRPSAQLVLPLAVAVYFPLVLYGFASRALALVWPGRGGLLVLATYGLWCLVQQYLAQSYFNNRLMRVLPGRHLSSAIVGLMFGSAHIPNPLLMAATTLGGFIFAEIFARHRNIWPLALAQAVGGFLIAALTPDSFLHHMRVGPGYFFWGIR
jgi:hypothetical protein